ncbi:MAG TPA: hypothetical protein VFO55_10220, partial [Gemmatimonadaceae bacterium]|nr:hypothetical protein [Gemmatimonadaceae bacterium]
RLDVSVRHAGLALPRDAAGGPGARHMSAIVETTTAKPFVTNLRARRGTIDLSRAGERAVTIRVEMPEVWDTVRIMASLGEPVAAIKRAALDALSPGAEHPEEFVIKLRGWEVLDEGASLGDAGALDGSIFLLTHRRRRPVK